MASCQSFIGYEIPSADLVILKHYIFSPILWTEKKLERGRETKKKKKREKKKVTKTIKSRAT